MIRGYTSPMVTRSATFLVCLIAVTATASYVLSLIVRVLTSREKKIDYKIDHLFSVTDEQFIRSMGITPEEWKNRPWTERVKERAAALLRSQL